MLEELEEGRRQRMIVHGGARPLTWRSRCWKMMPGLELRTATRLQGCEQGRGDWGSGVATGARAARGGGWRGHQERGGAVRQQGGEHGWMEKGGEEVYQQHARGLGRVVQ